MSSPERLANFLDREGVEENLVANEERRVAKSLLSPGMYPAVEACLVLSTTSGTSPVIEPITEEAKDLPAETPLPVKSRSFSKA